MNQSVQGDYRERLVLLLSVILIGIAMTGCAADSFGNQGKAEVPDPLVYDMTEQAKCSGIVDYLYNRKGQLIGERQYRYSDRAQPVFHLVAETRYKFDKNGEILDKTPALMSQFGTPPGYEYQNPCEHTEDGMKVCQYIKQKGDAKVVWLDYYDEEGHLNATCYGVDDEDYLSELSYAELEVFCMPGYYAHYDGDRLIDEISDQIDRDDFYTIGEYDFYDYDEEGRQIWRYRGLIDADDHFYAYQSVYDDAGRKVREIEYIIYGGWKHTLYDGTSIELKRNEDDRITDITRYDENGNVLYAYQLCPAEEGSAYLQLTYSIDAEGEISALWHMPLLYYQVIYGKKGDFGAGKEESSGKLSGTVSVHLDAEGVEIDSYEDFLNGKCSAVTKEDFHGKKYLEEELPEGEYKLSELIYAEFGVEPVADSDANSAVNFDAGHEMQVAYALTDIGGDGRQELFVKCDGAMSWGDCSFVMAFYFDGGKVCLSFVEYEGDRSSLLLTKDGYVYAGGSNSAASFGGESGRMGADGRYEQWYQIEAGTGWGIQNLPILPSEERWDVYNQVFGEKEIEEPPMEMYVYTVDKQIYYEYFIHDEAAEEERTLCEQYAACCEELGHIRFSMPEEIERILKQKREALGITEDMEKAQETDLEWVAVNFN